MIENEVVQEVTQEVAVPEVNSEIQSTSEQAAPVEAAKPVETAPIESSKEKNLRILRERAERAERERDELLRSNQPKQAQEPEEDDLGIGNDDYAEGKHLRKLKQEIKQLKQEMANSSNVVMETKLRAQLTDLDKVISRENLEALRDLDPDSAAAIDHIPDLYLKAKMAYKAIKQNKINEESYDQEKEIARNNLSKPKPLASISPTQGGTPLSKANAFQSDFSEESLKETYKEMRKILGRD
jgi:hypothetical protein